jgi:hypothetical protein
LGCGPGWNFMMVAAVFGDSSWFGTMFFTVRSWRSQIFSLLQAVSACGKNSQWQLAVAMALWNPDLVGINAACHGGQRRCLTDRNFTAPWTSACVSLRVHILTYDCSMSELTRDMCWKTCNF